MDRWVAETGDTVSQQPTETNIDLATGAPKSEFKRGQPPGFDANAVQVNLPGPVLDQ
jgi:hypothetical protein